MGGNTLQFTLGGEVAESGVRVARNRGELRKWQCPREEGQFQKAQVPPVARICTFVFEHESHLVFLKTTSVRDFKVSFDICGSLPHGLCHPSMD